MTDATSASPSPAGSTSGSSSGSASGSTGGTPAGPASTRRGWWARFRSWPRGVRVTAYLSILVVLLLVATLVTAVVLVRRPLPQTDGTRALPGLGAEVTVLRDAHGIPQVYGDSVADLMRAQGYVHAQERFFEMDVRRHATAGRLAELFGEAGLESDLMVRTMGWRRVAEREIALLNPDTRAALDAYAAGVNAYLDQRGRTDIALEYTVLAAGGLDYEPEPWTPVDSVAWLKAMAWDLRGNVRDEIQRVVAASAVPPRQARQLFPTYPWSQHAPIVTGGAVVDEVFEQDATVGGTRNPQRPAFAGEGTGSDPLTRLVTDLDTALEGMPAWLGRGDGLGSNSWVLGGDRTATGEPILANDPHLGVGLPGVWMQMGLHCRDVGPQCPLDVAGFTFSGVPGVVIGHNADIAWGMTNLRPDVTDLFVERVRGDEWFYDGSWRPMARRTEVIEVADGEDVTITVRSTRHGPLLSDVSDEFVDVADDADLGPRATRRVGDEFGLSLQWTALQPAPTADAILALNLATDWRSFRAAAESFSVPAQNLVYADREGHIGYQAPGRVPIRQSGNDGRSPSAGWLPENDWTGEFVPFDALPSVLDPEAGLVVAANQAVVGRGYPYRLTDDWDRGYRSDRISELLEKEEQWSVEDTADLQLDAFHPMAPVLVPHLLETRMAEGYYADGQELLAAWDFQQDADSAAAAYFNVVWRRLLELTFHDELPEAGWPDGNQRWFAVVTRMLRNPTNIWWDDVATELVVETRSDILRSVMRDARDELTRLQALDAEDWEWGRLHELDLRSPTLGESGVGLVERLVNRDGWHPGGGSSAVNATSWDAADGYGVTAAPSMRMVVSLADLDDSRWINLTGVSGHPFSAHYTDQTDLWTRGETLPWPSTTEAVEAAVEHTLTLEPAAD